MNFQILRLKGEWLSEVAVRRLPLKLALLSAVALLPGVSPVGAVVYVTGNETVTAGATWAVGDTIAIGDAGTPGTLTISAGGRVTTLNGYLADAVGGDGTVTVTGTGSEWILSGNLYVARQSLGTLNISNGGAVSSSGLSVGAFSGAGSGVITITGENSRLTVNGDAKIGSLNDGTVTVSDGGTLSVTGGSRELWLGDDDHGTLNIGAANGSAAAAAGTIDASKIVFRGSTGTLVFNHTETDYTFDLDVTAGSGYGYLQHLSGTTTLTGATTFKGAAPVNLVPSSIYVDGGTLRVANGGSMTVDVSNLDIGTSNSADGRVVVTGTGSTITLGGPGMNVGYYGKGTFVVSDGGKVSGGEVNLALVAGSSGSATVTGANSLWNATSTIVGYRGSASLTLAGGGTARMDGGTGTLTVAKETGSTGTVNIGAAAGETAAAAGTLDAATVAFGSGTGSLVFNHTVTGYEFDADVTGNGTLAFHAGTTKLTGDYTAFTGTAEIRGGTLDLASSTFDKAVGVYDGGLLSVNSTATNPISIYSGGTLAGSGTVSNVTLASGAKVAPGNSIGTLNVSGNLTFVSGSTYEVEVDSSGNADKVAATGTVTIDSGATLSIIAENGTDDGSTYNTTTDYTILTAGSLSGTFGTVTENFAYLSADVSYSSTEATLTLTRMDTDFAAEARTPNQVATANAVETLGAGNQIYDAVAALPHGEPADAFQQLSGEMHVSVQGTFMAGAGIDRSAMNQRLLTAGGGVGAGQGGQVSMAFHGEGAEPPLSPANAQAWGQVHGGWGEVDATSNTAGVTSYGGGFLTGIDAEIVDGWRTGVMAGYSRTQFDSSGNNSSGSADSYHAGVYAGTGWGLGGGTLGLRMGASYTLHDLDTERNVAFTGYSDRLTAGYNAATAQGFAEVGYAVTFDAGRLEPFAGIAAVHEHTDGFTETGGAAALTSAGSDDLMGVTTLGLRGEAVVASKGGVNTALFGSLAWRHALGDTDPSATMRFASGGDSFAISGTPIDSDTALFGAGLSFQKDDSIGLSFSYQGEIGDTAQDHSARANLRISF